MSHFSGTQLPIDVPQASCRPEVAPKELVRAIVKNTNPNKQLILVD